MNPSLRNTRVIALSLLSVALLAGCATRGNFTCSGDDSGDRCRSTAEIYELTNGYTGAAGIGSEDAEAVPESRDRQPPAVPEHFVATTGNALVLSEPIQPVTGAVEGALRLGGDPTRPLEQPPLGGSESVARVPAQVMRIWLAPWTDEVGDLHMPGFVYTEIKSRRWSIGGDVRAREQSSFDPNGPWLPSTTN